MCGFFLILWFLVFGGLLVQQKHTRGGCKTRTHTHTETDNAQICNRNSTFWFCMYLCVQHCAIEVKFRGVDPEDRGARPSQNRKKTTKPIKRKHVVTDEGRILLKLGLVFWFVFGFSKNHTQIRRRGGGVHKTRELVRGWGS